MLTKDTHETVIRFAPPLTISYQALDWGIDVFAAVLSEFARMLHRLPRTASHARRNQLLLT